MIAPPMIAALPIAADHAAFAGHFPGMPILPGAALLEAALGHITASRRLDLTRWRVTVKFLEVVRPGDVLTLEHASGSATSIGFSIRNPHGTVASGTLTVSAPLTASGAVTVSAPAPQDAHGA